VAESSRAKLIERAIPQERARPGTELESLRTCARGPVVGKKRKPKMGPMPKCRLTGEGGSFTGTSQKGVGSGSKTWRKMGPIRARAHTRERTSGECHRVARSETTRKHPENKPKTDRKPFASYECHSVTPFLLQRTRCRKIRVSA